MKAILVRGTLVALVALFLTAGTAAADHVPCVAGQGHCEEPSVPGPGEDKQTGTAKVIPQAPLAEEPSLLEEIGAFLGAVGDGMARGVGAVGEGVSAAVVGVGALVVALVKPVASLLASLRPAGLPLPLYAGMTSAGTAAVAGGAQFGLWALFRKLFPLGLPLVGLFSRIEKDELLVHERRARIFELIKHNPGIHLSGIARDLEYAWGTTLHHLRKLRADRLILFKDIGHHKSFFINGSGLSEKQMEAMSLIKNGTLAKLAHYLEAHPRTSLKEMSEALRISPPLAAFHIRKLEKAGLVQKAREGKTVRLSTTQVLPAGFLSGIGHPGSAPAAVAVDAPSA